MSIIYCCSNVSCDNETAYRDKEDICDVCGSIVQIDVCGSIVQIMDYSKSPVNHPPHYTSHPSGIECITIVEHMPFNIGNAIKYLWRAGLKDNAPTVQDYEKAIWYVQREIGRIKANGE